jgi:crotonobetainyl-CoA:carnitine CoA-transferase CaiB-like acyl-CoA transferase
VTTSAECLADPQLEALDHFLEVDHAECGRVPIENARVRLSRTPAVVTRPGPTLGEHNDIILRELLELSDDEITELAISGALE